MQIIEVDPYDDDMVRAWRDVYLRSHRHDRPWATPWQLAEVQPEMQDGGRRRVLRTFAGVVDASVVTAGSISFPLLDNTNVVTVEVNTDPVRRRLGHGSKMLAHLEAIVGVNGRCLVNAEPFFPLNFPVDGAGNPDADFLTVRGYRFVLGDVMSTLDLPVNKARLADLGDRVSPHQASYRIEAFVGRVPDEIAASFAALSASLMTRRQSGRPTASPSPPMWRPTASRRGRSSARAGRRTTPSRWTQRAAQSPTRR